MVSLQELRDALKVVNDYFEETCYHSSKGCIAYQDGGMNSLCNPGLPVCVLVSDTLELVEETLREESEDKKRIRKSLTFSGW